MNKGFGKRRDSSVVVYGTIGVTSRSYSLRISAPAYGPAPLRKVPRLHDHLTVAIRIACAHSD